jgi:hypothetical protein
VNAHSAPSRSEAYFLAWLKFGKREAQLCCEIFLADLSTACFA